MWYSVLSLKGTIYAAFSGIDGGMPKWVNYSSLTLKLTQGSTRVKAKKEKTNFL